MTQPPPSPLRIALVTETWPPEINGVAHTLAHFARGLGARGHRVTLVRPRPFGRIVGARPPEMLVPAIPLPGYAGLRIGVVAPGRLRRAWRRQPPDVVYVATEGPLGAAALRASGQLGIPVVAGFHTDFPAYCRHYHLGWLSPAVGEYLRRFHRRAACTIAPTPALAAALHARGYGEVTVIGRGVDTTLFTPARYSGSLRNAWGIPPDGLVILHVGRLAPEKNIGLLLDAWRGIHATQPDARLVVVGDGPLLARLRRTEPRVLFLGARRGEELARCYASADLFLFPSHHDTFGNVTLEALSSGLAVVAFAQAAAALHIRHRISGILVPRDDEAVFVARATELATDPALRARVRGNARSAVAHLAHEAVAERLEQTLRLVTNRGGAVHDPADRLHLAG